MLEWWWMLRIAPNLNKFLAIVFSVISVCIIWSEIVFNVRRPVIISIVYYVLNACGTNYAALEVKKKGGEGANLLSIGDTDTA